MRISVFHENVVAAARAKKRTPEDLYAELRGAGLDSLYLSDAQWKRDRTWLRPLTESLRLGVEGMYAFFDFARDPESQAYRGAVDTAVESGAGSLLIVPGFFATGNTVRDLGRLIEGVRRTVAYGAEKGVPVVMEAFDDLLAPYNKSSGLLHFLQSVPGLGIAFDTGNFTFFHEDAAEVFDLFADAVRTVHLKDLATEPRHPKDTFILCADMRRAYPCATGSGFVPIPAILQKLRARGYDGGVVIELFRVDSDHLAEDILASIRWVKEAVKGENR